MSDEWTEVDTEMIRWTEPTTLEGIYLGYEEIDTKFGVGYRHTIRVEDKAMTFFAPTNLHAALSRVPINARIRLVYTGETVRKPGAKGDQKVFKVHYKEPESKPPSDKIPF